MQYQRMKFGKILRELDSEEKARAWIWLAKFDGKNFVCRGCHAEEYYQQKKIPEIRKCKTCGLRVRLRANTIFQNSKTPLLVWLKIICFVTQGKRGISALELQAALELKSYDTTWVLLHKVREALKQRDEEYKLKDIIELDGTVFGRRQANNQTNVLVAIESKIWIDKKGRQKFKAGFAKITVATETKEEVQKFINKNIEKNSTLHTDKGSGIIYVDNAKVEYRAVSGNKELLDHWLPWVHRFVSNAKSWVVGTHHGVGEKYLGQYLSEYTFRFNRRHDPDSLFFRALGACTKASPKTSGTLFG